MRYVKKYLRFYAQRFRSACWFVSYTVKVLKVLCAAFKNCPTFYAQRCENACRFVSLHSKSVKGFMRHAKKLPKVSSATL